MLASLIIVMRETLEAVFIFGVLSALADIRKIGQGWILQGLVLGVLGATLFSMDYDEITEALNGTGQEVLLALVHGSVAAILLLVTFDIVQYRLQSQSTDCPSKTRGLFSPRALHRIYSICIALAMSVEAGEVIIYLSEQLQLVNSPSILVYGSLIGLGIGVSAGFLVWAILTSLKHWQLESACALFILLSAGLVSQSISFLAQAGLVDEGKQLFNIESWLSETSITGQILYALFSYESSPSALQFFGYIATLCIALAGIFMIYHFKRKT